MKDGVVTLYGCVKYYDKHHVEGAVEKEARAYDVHGRTRSSEGMENLWVMQFAVTPQISRMDLVLYHTNPLFRKRQVTSHHK
jgi:hypothetical protein